MRTTIMTMIAILMTVSASAGKVVPKSYDAIVRLTAATIYLEAGSESNQGNLGVASAIWNRAGGAVYIPNVIMSRKQFSCWNHRTLASFKPPKNKNYAYCLAVARDMVAGTFVPPAMYRNVISYHAKSVRPTWRHSLAMKVCVGCHLFYREKGWWLA